MTKSFEVRLAVVIFLVMPSALLLLLAGVTVHLGAAVSVSSRIPMNAAAPRLHHFLQRSRTIVSTTPPSDDKKPARNSAVVMANSKQFEEGFAKDAEAVISKGAADAEAALAKGAADAEAAIAKTAADAEAALFDAEAVLVKGAAEAEAAITKTAADAEAALSKTAEEVLEKARADAQIITDVSGEAVVMATEAVESVRAATESSFAAAEAAQNEAADRLVAIAEAASKQTAAMSALTGGFTGGFLSRLPGGLLAKRTTEIWTFAAEITAKMAVAQRSSSRERKLAVSEDLCEGLLRLGPTFIKLGQILSTRYDILPYDYVKGLERLQACAISSHLPCTSRAPPRFHGLL